MSRDDRTSGIHFTKFPLAEDIVFTVVSAIIVVVAITVIFMPPVMSLAANVSVDATPNPSFIGVYGNLSDADGNPLKGEDIYVYDSRGSRVAFSKTGNGGFFDFHFRDGGDTYTISVTVEISRNVFVTETIDLWMEPGFNYGLDLTLSESDTIVIVPIPVY